MPNIGRFFGASLVAEHHRMHDAAGQQREQAGDHERADEDRDHGVAVSFDAMPPGMHNRKRQRSQGEDRKQMDRAPSFPDTQVVDKERGRRHSHHERDPDPADGAMRECTLGAASWTAPRPKAAMAANACSCVAGAAFSSGASDTRYSPTYRTPALRDCLNLVASAGAELAPRASKRNLVVHVAALAGTGQGRLFLARRRTGGTEFIFLSAEVTAAAIARAVEHGQLRIEVLQHHLGGVFVLARLVLPFARLQLPLEINLRPLLQILLGDPAKSLIEDDNAVPLRALAALAGCLVAPSFRGRHAQIRDRAAVLRTPDLGVFAEIANQDHLIDATGHDALLLMCACPSEPNQRSGPSRRPASRHHAFPQQALSQAWDNVLYLF